MAREVCKYHYPQKIPGVFVHLSQKSVPRFNMLAHEGLDERVASKTWDELVAQMFNTRQNNAIQTLKRTLREWPTCALGGTIEVNWRQDGVYTRRAQFVCAKCR